ncbi:hypothetical protein DFH28DRAFT_886328 [Melampsora americana]|nr:hypothetical protein DFH28DRAFT_886328 [Melampsora americana]
MHSAHPLVEHQLNQLTPQRWLRTDDPISQLIPNLEKNLKPIKSPTSLAHGSRRASKWRALSSSTTTADQVEILKPVSPMTWDTGFGGRTEDQHIHHLIKDIQTVMYDEAESKGLSKKNGMLIERISDYILSEKSQEMKRGKVVAIRGLYLISQNRKLSSYTASYAKNFIYNLLMKQKEMGRKEDVLWKTYFSLECKSIYSFLVDVLNSGKFNGESIWRFIEKKFNERNLLLLKIKNHKHDHQEEVEEGELMKVQIELNQIINDSWELWIPAFVMATSVTKTHEKDLLHLLLEFSKLNPTKTFETSLTLRENEIKIMAQRACVALAERSTKLKSYYIYWLQTSANEVLKKNQSLESEIQKMMREVTEDGRGVLQRRWKDELKSLAQLNFMIDLRYQNQIQLLVELAISRILEKGSEASNDFLFKDVLNTLQDQRKLRIPVPDRQMFLSIGLRKLSQIISYHRPTRAVHPQSSM